MAFVVHIMVIAVAMILFSTTTSTTATSDQSNTHWHNAIDGLDHDYDRTVTPGYAGEHVFPTVVLLSFFVESIGNFRSTSMDFEVDLYLMEYWSDERLRHTRSMPVQSDRQDLMDEIWMPDLFIVNSKEARYNEVTRPNRILQIFRDGRVRFSVRVSARLFCSMSFHNYPFDKQICCIKFMPYGHNMSFLMFQWSNVEGSGHEPIRVNPSVKEFDFVLDRKVYPTYCDGTFVEGNYSCLTAKFILHRTHSHSLLQTYAPTFSIVAISWISFWIDPESVPGRTGLCVTTLLTLTTMASWASRNTPVVSYVKALDVWLTMCLMFLFGSLLEFTAVNLYTRRSAKQKEPTNSLSPMDAVYAKHLQRLSNSDYETAVNIDRISRAAFPLAFLTFMFVYFVYYMWLAQPEFNDCENEFADKVKGGTCQCQ